MRHCVGCFLLAVLLAGVAAPSLAAGGYGLSYWWLIPAAASNPGLNGTYWRLDLSVLNPYSWRSITVRIGFLRERTDNREVPTKDFTIDPGGQLFLEDVVKNQFGVTGKGALELWTDDEACFTPNAHSYTTGPMGTSGHEVPGQQWTVKAEGRAFTAGIRVDSRYRTNIGVVSASNVPISILAEALDGNGNVRGAHLFNLLPRSTEQVGVSSFAGEFGTGSVRWTCLTSDTDYPSIYWVAYATTVDNTSGDANYLEERQDDVYTTARPQYDLSGRWQGTLSIAGLGNQQVTVTLCQRGAWVSSAYIYSAATGGIEAFLTGVEDQGTITFNGEAYLFDYLGSKMWGTATVTSSTAISGSFSGTGRYANGGSFAFSRMPSASPAPIEEGTERSARGRPAPGRDLIEP